MSYGSFISFHLTSRRPRKRLPTGGKGTAQRRRTDSSKKLESLLKQAMNAHSQICAFSLGASKANWCTIVSTRETGGGTTCTRPDSNVLPHCANARYASLHFSGATGRICCISLQHYTTVRPHLFASNW